MAELAATGTTCIRMMLEYAQHTSHYLEKPVGVFQPLIVQFWDDLFALCERYGLRILLTPFDTFWTWIRWKSHPYNEKRGGCLSSPSRFLLDARTREAIKARLTFAVERWGGSGALFAWDLWNEIHPAHAEESADNFGEFIADLSHHVRRLETKRYGRSHPQTVSLFGPELEWRAHMPLREPIFRHPDLDFASIHIYAARTIDDPRNTVDAALDMGRIVAESISETPRGRPFLDSEHGPIHAYKDRKRVLPAVFDDEYFRHMQWAHLAAGGAGGGMRWPNRRPHVLTRGMRDAQGKLNGFLDLIDWARFARQDARPALTLTRQGRHGPIPVSDRKVGVCASASVDQAVMWLVRRDSIGRDGRLDTSAKPLEMTVGIEGLAPGDWDLTGWNTRTGAADWTRQVAHSGASLAMPLELQTDLAIALRRRGP